MGARVEHFVEPVVEGSSSTKTVSNVPAWLAACTWTLLEPGDEMPAEFGNEVNFGFEDDGTPLPIDEATWVVSCPTDSIIAIGFGDFATGIVDVYADGEPPSQPLIDAVRQEALDQVPLVAFNPITAPPGTSDAPLVTRFPTLLWVDEAAWVPVTATASIPGLTVTATGTPTEAVWSGGDELPDVCEAGAPWDPGVEWEDQEFGCSMVFWHSSTVQDYELSVEVRWEKTWECSAFCGAGVADPDFTVGSRPVTVGEIQALIQCWGAGCDDYTPTGRRDE